MHLYKSQGGVTPLLRNKMTQVLEWIQQGVSTNSSLLCILFFLFVFLVLKFQKAKSTVNLPPSPPKLPLIGNLHQMHGLLHHTLRTLSQKYGPIMLLHLGQVPTLVVSSAEMAEEVMKTQDHIFSGRPQLQTAVRLSYGKDIAFSPYGDYWRQIRKVCVLQLLSSKKVQSFGFVREQEVALMMETIKAAAVSSSVVNLSEMIVSLTNDVICRVALGRKYGEGEVGRRFRGLVNEMTHLLGVSNVGDFIPSLAWLNYFNGLNRRLEKCFKEADTFLDEVIEEHIQKKKSRGDAASEEEEEEDLVDVLLGIEQDTTLGFQLERDTTKALILDMFFAGTDTTSVALEWAMSELIKHPEIMKDVQKEVRDISGEKTAIHEIDIKELHCIRLILKETLRLHPPVPLLIPHESTENSIIHGYDVPTKSTIMINAFAIGRDPTFWDKPDTFWPKRFLNREIYSLVDSKSTNFHFIPFGAGRRGCPGRLFATSLLEVALANLLCIFDWTLPNGTDSKNLDMEEAYGITTHRKNDLLLSPKLHYI